jgi:hypothetical protein
MSACHSSKNASSSYVATDGNGWHDVYMPVKVKLTSPMSMSLSGRATMVRDSLIYMSMRVFGMEVAVMNMTGDSVMFVDKYHKYLFSESLDKVMGSHKLSIGDIQNIALGLQSGSNNKLTFNNPESDKPVTITFADFYNTPAGNIAQTISIEAPLSKNDVNADVLWSANSADWNTGRTANYVAPDKNYKRVSIDAVLKMFKKM